MVEGRVGGRGSERVFIWGGELRSGLAAEGRRDDKSAQNIHFLPPQTL